MINHKRLNKEFFVETLNISTWKLAILFQLLMAISYSATAAQATDLLGCTLTSDDSAIGNTYDLYSSQVDDAEKDIVEELSLLVGKKYYVNDNDMLKQYLIDNENKLNSSDSILKRSNMELDCKSPYVYIQNKTIGFDTVGSSGPQIVTLEDEFNHKLGCSPNEGQTCKTNDVGITKDNDSICPCDIVAFDDHISNKTDTWKKNHQFEKLGFGFWYDSKRDIYGFSIANDLWASGARKSWGPFFTFGYNSADAHKKHFCEVLINGDDLNENEQYKQTVKSFVWLNNQQAEDCLIKFCNWIKGTPTELINIKENLGNAEWEKFCY